MFLVLLNEHNVVCNTDLACIMCNLPHLQELFNACDELNYGVDGFSGFPFPLLLCGLSLWFITMVLLLWLNLRYDGIASWCFSSFPSLGLYSFIHLFNFQNGMHSLCPAVWSKHRRWLLMSMLCLNPLACVSF